MADKGRIIETFVMLLLFAVLAPIALAGQSSSFARPPGEHFPLSPNSHRNMPTFKFGKPVAGTTYFYWYDVDTSAHIVNHDGSDALTTHPADMKDLSFKRTSWHRRQLLDMIDARLDFFMPVYWGVPGRYDGWSFRGLPPLVEAHDSLLKEGRMPPLIGLFYDTSILRYSNAPPGGPNQHIDLSTESGKDWFYTAMRDFFSMIPPSKWARVDGRPIVFLYAAEFAKAQDPAQMPYVRKRFAADFGVDPFIVKHRDWQGDAYAIYQWGGAIALQIDEHVAALGPGYDHSAVPGRAPLIVDRRGGATYSDNWERLLALSPSRRPWMVHVETWNEWHEGTDVAHSLEYGRMYIDLTRKYADLFRQGVQVPIQGLYADVTEVHWDPDNAQGMSVRPCGGDGEWGQLTAADRTYIITRPNTFSAAQYLYFCVDDSFAYDADETMYLTVQYRDDGCDAFTVQYDNTDYTQGPVQGAFRDSQIVRINGTSRWKTVTLTLPHCRFVNRCNQADLRLAPTGGSLSLAVSRLTLRKDAPDFRSNGADHEPVQ